MSRVILDIGLHVHISERAEWIEADRPRPVGEVAIGDHEGSRGRNLAAGIHPEHNEIDKNEPETIAR